MNVLVITLDQFRADSWGGGGHPLVQTPTLDTLAREGVTLAKHFSQAAPCSPGRAALYTGTYQMNNRVVANGTPLARHMESIATVARDAGYDPTLFGYTDQGVDPVLADGADDPRLDSYDGVLPGLSVGLYLPESQAGWVQWLRSHGHDVPYGWEVALRGESERPAELSLSAFLTDRFVSWLDRQPSGWFAYLSYLRPHPPYAAAGHFSRLYDPADVPLPLAPATSDRHPVHEAALQFAPSRAPQDEQGMRHLRAQYYGMISEVDDQLGRVVEAIQRRGEWDDTLVVVTSDHGDQLGDHGLVEKLGFFPQSYHVVGVWRDPRRADPGRRVTCYTENVDVLPTLAETLGVPVPAQCDGRSLVGVLDGADDPTRRVAHYEWDYRWYAQTGWDVDPTRRHTSGEHNLAVSVSDDVAFVQFADGSSRCFDLAADPTWRTPLRDPDRELAAAREQLTWRQRHQARGYSDVLLSAQRRGWWDRSRVPATG